MTLTNTVGPPPPPPDPWTAKFYQWVTKVWFPKQRSLGTGLAYDSLDRVALDVTIPRGVSNGDIMVWRSGNWYVLPVGANGTVLTADNTAGPGVKWA